MTKSEYYEEEDTPRDERVHPLVSLAVILGGSLAMWGVLLWALYKLVL